jgi:hypothetical protein
LRPAQPPNGTTVTLSGLVGGGTAASPNSESVGQSRGVEIAHLSPERHVLALRSLQPAIRQEIRVMRRAFCETRILLASSFQGRHNGAGPTARFKLFVSQHPIHYPMHFLQ